MMDYFLSLAEDFRLPHRSQGVPVDGEPRTLHSPDKRPLNRGNSNPVSAEDAVLSKTELDKFYVEVKGLGPTQCKRKHFTENRLAKRVRLDGTLHHDVVSGQLDGEAQMGSNDGRGSCGLCGKSRPRTYCTVCRVFLCNKREDGKAACNEDWHNSESNLNEKHNVHMEKPSKVTPHH